MNKSDKTSQKLLDSIRKTKASADVVEDLTAPHESKTEASPQTAAQLDAKENNTEVSVRRILSSRRVWPD